MDITAAGIANKNKNGKDVGKWYINLAKYSEKKNLPSPNSRFAKYEGDRGFAQLKSFYLL